jgi:general secretion pathway protein L
MTRKIIGIDIRHDLLSVALLHRGSRENSLVNYALIPLTSPHDFQEALANALAIVSERENITGIPCAVSLPATDISIRNIQLPFKQDRKIRQILPLELESSLARPWEEYVFDYQIVQSGVHTDIIAVAVEKSRMASLLAAFTANHLDPSIISVGAHTAANLIAHQLETEDQHLFISLEKKEATLFFVVSGKIYLIRPLTLSSLSSSHIEGILSGVKRTCIAFETLFGFKFSPAEILLARDDAFGPDLDERIGAELGVPVARIDFFKETGILLSSKSGEAMAPLKIERAIILALYATTSHRGFNLRQGPFKIQKPFVRHKKQLMLTAFLALFLVLTTVSNIWYNAHVTEKKLEQVNQQIAALFQGAFPGNTRMVDALHQMKTKINDAKKTIQNSGNNLKSIKTVTILDEISRNLPGSIDVELTKLVTGQESVLISGTTKTFNAVDDMKTGLEKVSLFNKVTISSANMDKGTNRVRFTLKIRLRET